MRKTPVPSYLTTTPYVTTTSVSSSYSFAPLIPDMLTFGGEIPQVPVLDRKTLIRGLDEITPTDIKSTYLNTIEGDVDFPIQRFLIIEFPTLSSFFAHNLIDVPVAFENLKSLYYTSASLPHARLINILTRHGRRLYVSKLYSSTLWQLARRLITPETGSEDTSSWAFIHSLFTSLTASNLTRLGTITSTLPKFLTHETYDKYAQVYDNDGYWVPGTRWLHNLLYEELAQHTPLFSFFIKRVDKRKRKHSRGKSGKYSIVWKYVPEYKRMLAVLRWLARDIRFQKGKTFQLRLSLSLETLFFSKQSHLILQVRSFVHTFAFQNFKKTLLRTLRHVS